jgi:hypothetical protein
MVNKKWTLKDSYNFVKERRSIIQPNEGFLSQLIQLEISLYGSSTMNTANDFCKKRCQQLSRKVTALHRSADIGKFSRDKLDKLTELCNRYKTELESLKQMGESDILRNTEIELEKIFICLCNS